MVPGTAFVAPLLYNKKHLLWHRFCFIDFPLKEPMVPNQWCLAPLLWHHFCTTKNLFCGTAFEL
jgi:hypothetical protein